METNASPAKRAITVASLLWMAAAVLPAGSALGGDGMALTPGQGPLDGMVFVGGFGAVDSPSDKSDKLYFGDGHFWSANCVPCGFSPGEYWVRENGDALQFRGELYSDERGRFVYEGTVRDGRLEAAINWRHERWYWTIERQFHFEGTLAPGESAGAATASAKLARTAVPDPEKCNL